MTTGISPGGRPIDESPLSTSKTSNYVARRGGLPPYIRGVARGIDPANPDSSHAISMAIAAIERWARGGSHVKPTVRAAAIEALARWKAITVHGKSLSNDNGSVIDLDWTVFDEARGLHPRIKHAVKKAKPRKRKVTPGVAAKRKAVIAARKEKLRIIQMHKDKREGEKWNRDHPVKAQHIVDAWNAATPEQIDQGKNWYGDINFTAKALSDNLNIPMPVVAGIIANYSPQTQWAQNLITALRVLRSGKGVGGKGSGVMATEGQKTRADQMLKAGTWKGVLSGQKITAFAQLIELGKDLDPENPDVVVDRHALSVAAGTRARDIDYTYSKLGTKGRYAQLKKVYLQAAKQISKESGEKVSPFQVQAATWLHQHAENEKESKAAGKAAKAALVSAGLWDQWNNLMAEAYPELENQVPGTGYASEMADLSSPFETVIDLNWEEFDAMRAAGRAARRKESKGKMDEYAKSIMTPEQMRSRLDQLKAERDSRASMRDNMLRAPKPPKMTERMVNTKSVTPPVVIPEESEFGDGVLTQMRAQRNAEMWVSEPHRVSAFPIEPPDYDTYGPRVDATPQSAWHAYQNPEYYPFINDALRGTDIDHGYGVSQEQFNKAYGKAMAAEIPEMFKKAGVRTARPIKLYRGLRGKNPGEPDWGDVLKPGSTFQDNGIVSTTAQYQFAQGWLGMASGDRGQDGISDKGALMEILVPKGTLTVGGNSEFIETMLPPGSKFKILSNDERIADGYNVVNDSPVTGQYTHIVAELVPSTEEPYALKGKSK